MIIFNHIDKLIIFSVNQLIAWFVKIQKIVRNVYHSYPEPKVTPS